MAGRSVLTAVLFALLALSSAAKVRKNRLLSRSRVLLETSARVGDIGIVPEDKLPFGLEFHVPFESGTPEKAESAHQLDITVKGGKKVDVDGIPGWRIDEHDNAVIANQDIKLQSEYTVASWVSFPLQKTGNGPQRRCVAVNQESGLFYVQKYGQMSGEPFGFHPDNGDRCCSKDGEECTTFKSLVDCEARKAVTSCPNSGVVGTDPHDYEPTKRCIQDPKQQKYYISTFAPSSPDYLGWAPEKGDRCCSETGEFCRWYETKHECETEVAAEVKCSTNAPMGVVPVGKAHTIARGSRDKLVSIREPDLELGVVELQDTGDAKSSHVDVWHGCGHTLKDLSAGWHHVAAVASLGHTTFFVDKERVCSTEYQVSSDFNMIGNDGRPNNPAGTSFYDFRLYSTALSERELAKIYDATEPDARRKKIEEELAKAEKQASSASTSAAAAANAALSDAEQAALAKVKAEAELKETQERADESLKEIRERVSDIEKRGHEEALQQMEKLDRARQQMESRIAMIKRKSEEQIEALQNKIHEDEKLASEHSDKSRQQVVDTRAQLESTESKEAAAIDNQYKSDLDELVEERDNELASINVQYNNDIANAANVQDLDEMARLQQGAARHAENERRAVRNKFRDEKNQLTAQREQSRRELQVKLDRLQADIRDLEATEEQFQTEHRHSIVGLEDEIRDVSVKADDEIAQEQENYQLLVTETHKNIKTLEEAYRHEESQLLNEMRRVGKITEEEASRLHAEINKRDGEYAQKQSQAYLAEAKKEQAEHQAEQIEAAAAKALGDAADMAQAASGAAAAASLAADLAAAAGSAEEASDAVRNVLNTPPVKYKFSNSNDGGDAQGFRPQINTYVSVAVGKV